MGHEDYFVCHFVVVTVMDVASTCRRRPGIPAAVGTTQVDLRLEKHLSVRIVEQILSSDCGRVR